MSTQGHHLNKLGSTRVLDAAYQNFQVHRPFGIREDFESFLTYIGMAAILVM